MKNRGEVLGIPGGSGKEKLRFLYIHIYALFMGMKLSKYK